MRGGFGEWERVVHGGGMREARGAVHGETRSAREGRRERLCAHQHSPSAARASRKGSSLTPYLSAPSPAPRPTCPHPCPRPQQGPATNSPPQRTVPTNSVFDGQPLGPAPASPAMRSAASAPPRPSGSSTWSATSTKRSRG